MPPSHQQRRVLTLVVAVLVVVALWWLQGPGEDTQPPGDRSSESTAEPSVRSGSTAGTDGAARSDTDPESGLPVVALADLPPEAAETLGLIDDGGPFPHDEDDGVFGNFEGILPDEQRGYYREYTVETPGLGHRGARRIVAGAGGELYWTDDHYSSFSRIAR